ncbi:MAG TPA: pinensin family lanthipeptide [Longimicrobium sp.]|uniref:pinensin family lanthipeptide n=1 Tax=Longimicrobium sp. TaxID=2029185 RepID=UPI002ED8903E
MKQGKLALSLDALEVQSFVTQDAEAAQGTVRANEDTNTTPCWQNSDVESCGGSCDYTYCGEYTCWETCAWSCPASCNCMTNEQSCNQTYPSPDGLGTCCRIPC